VGDDGRAVGSDCTQTEEEEKRLWAEEMNDKVLNYAMIGGRPKEKQQAIE
jgi:hypothetical protein